MDAEDPDFDKGNPKLHWTCIKIIIKQLDTLEMKEHATAAASA